MFRPKCQRERWRFGMGLESIFKRLCKCHSENVVINLWYPFWASTLSLSLKLGVNRPLTGTKESGLYMRNTYSVIVIALYRWAWRNNFIDISVSELPSFSILSSFALQICPYYITLTTVHLNELLNSWFYKEGKCTPNLNFLHIDVQVSFRRLLRFNLYPTMTH